MLSKIKAADAQARRRFNYKADPGRDTWRSFATDVKAGKSWSGDCDDLASTAADLAAQAGVPLANLWFAAVSSTRGKTIDHLIAIAKDEDGRYWTLGDTFGPCVLITKMEHSLIDVHNMTWPVKKWMRVNSVGAFLAMV